MVRLPVDQSDNNVWGPILNEFLEVSHNSDGTHIGGAYGAAANGAVSAGASGLTLSDTPPSGFASRASLVSIGYGTTCELRTISSVTGKDLVFDRVLTYAHANHEPVIWYPSGVVPLGMWGAKGDNTTDDTTAVQAALDQSAIVSGTQNNMAWITGTGCRYVITRPLMFSSGVRVKSIGKFKASTASWGTWGAVAESTNAMGISVNGLGRPCTATAADNIVTTSTSHGMVVGQKVVFTGASLPAPLISGRVYFVKTVPGVTTMTLALTSGGAEIDLTTDGSGDCYPAVSQIERVYFDDVYFDGGGVAGLNGFRLACQQPHEWKKVRFDSCPGYGVNVMGQIGHFYNLELVSCGRGLVLGEFGSCTGMDFFGLNMTNNTVNSVEVKSQNCGLYGLWIERSPIGIHFNALSYGTVIDAPQFSMTNTSDPCIRIEAGAANSLSFDMRGSRFSNSAQLVIDDIDRGFQLTALQIDQHAQSLGSYSQPAGPVAPNISNNSVRTLTTTYTAHLADETLLCNATGGAFTVTLPSAVAIKGKRYVIKRTNSGANAVTVGTTSSQTIDLPGGAAATTRVLGAQYTVIEVVSDGANWGVVSMAGTVT